MNLSISKGSSDPDRAPAANWALEKDNIIANRKSFRKIHKRLTAIVKARIRCSCTRPCICANSVHDNAWQHSRWHKLYSRAHAHRHLTHSMTVQHTLCPLLVLKYTSLFDFIRFVSSLLLRTAIGCPVLFHGLYRLRASCSGIGSSVGGTTQTCASRRTMLPLNDLHTSRIRVMDE